MKNNKLVALDTLNNLRKYGSAAALALAAAARARQKVTRSTVTKKSQSYTKTKTQQKKKKRFRQGTQTAYMDGFVKSNNKKRRPSRARTLGVRYDIEAYRSNYFEASASALYLIHGTMPIATVHYLACQAIIKAIFVHLGYTVPTMTTATPGLPGTAGAALLRVRYYDSWSATTSIDIDMPFTDGTTTFDALALLFAGNLSTLTSQVRFRDLILFGDAAGTTICTQMNLQGSMLHFTSKAALKVQNRTIEATGDNEADDVNNVPLTGKTYEGTGGGTTHIASRIPLAIESNYGVAFLSDKTAVSSSSGPWPMEPPKPAEVMNCKKSGKIRLDPGKIKTSVLTTKETMSLDRFFYYTSNEGLNPATQKPYTNLGKWRALGFERMIAKTPGATLPDTLSLSFEQQLSIECYFSFRNSYVTEAMNSSTAV